MTRHHFAAVVLGLTLGAASVGHAQTHGHEGHVHDAGTTPTTSSPDQPDALATFFMQQSSGTSTQPASWPMPMWMKDHAGWQFGVMGQAFLVSTAQSGPRGDDGVYSVNWLMASAGRSVGRGRVQFRIMTSAEPATTDRRRYPLLFQTGESAYGTPLVDGQHPHDFFMELSAQYARPLGRGGIASVYYGVVGDAAVGPVAFPHRASALELPQATLGHHWHDSTHIASNVLTIGWTRGPVRLEASAFHGTEPDERRWDVDLGAMNSWSVRTSVAPHANWMGQVSFARLRQPESFHPDDVDRTTASVHHVAARGDGDALATSVMWATNRKSVARTRTHAVAVETLVPVASGHLVSGRLEWTQRDELFEYDHDLAHEIAERTGKTAFDVTALTLGYTRELAATGGLGVGVGATVTRYWTDRALVPFYGAKPWGASVFLRLRVRGPSGNHGSHAPTMAERAGLAPSEGQPRR
ncbi:MAG: hypothetical protein KJ066_14465 [Acidobacteria bacterium]|nr:hypothetical protein [Acidobacteriota bacterium]